MTLEVPQTIGPVLSTQAIPLIQAGLGDPVLVYNGDITNVLLLSPFPLPVPMASIPVQPLTSVVINDKRKYWGIAQTGTIASVTVAPEGTVMSPSPGQVAAQISALGLATDANLTSFKGVAAKDATVTGVAKDATLISGAQIAQPQVPSLQFNKTDVNAAAASTPIITVGGAFRIWGIYLCLLALTGNAYVSASNFVEASIFLNSNGEVFMALELPFIVANTVLQDSLSLGFHGVSLNADSVNLNLNGGAAIANLQMRAIGGVIYSIP